MEQHVKKMCDFDQLGLSYKPFYQKKKKYLWEVIVILHSLSKPSEKALQIVTYSVLYKRS